MLPQCAQSGYPKLLMINLVSDNDDVDIVSLGRVPTRNFARTTFPRGQGQGPPYDEQP